MKKNSIVLILAALTMSTTYQALPPCVSPEPVTNRENSALYKEVLAADQSFMETYEAQPDMFAKDKAIVLTCMDPRLLLDAIMGFSSGDMYVLRNAGGLATIDMLRSLVIAYKLLAANQIFVIQHTDCGMQKFTNKVMDKLLRKSIVTATLPEPCEVYVEPRVCDWENVCKCSGKKNCKNYPCTDWLPIEQNLYLSVIETVRTIRNYPLIPSDVPIYGFIFDVLTGELIVVEEAMRVGRAKPLNCKK